MMTWKILTVKVEIKELNMVFFDRKSNEWVCTDNFPDQQN